MNDVPTLQHEVERKAVEALEMIAIDRDMGKITEAQYGYALTVLWASCAGIAGDDFMIMMEVAKSPVKSASSFTKQYYLSKSGKVVRVTNTHTGVACLDINLGHAQSRKVYDYRDEPQATKIAQAKFQDLCNSMTTKGFSAI